MVIAGLTIEPEAERRIWAEFESWPEYFRGKVASLGTPWLLAEYRAVIESIETRSCHHGPGGQCQTGQAWQECCGISYEYLNDIAVRDALQVILAEAPPDSTRELAEQIAELDDRLYALFSTQPPRSGRWWSEGLPNGVVE